MDNLVSMNAGEFNYEGNFRGCSSLEEAIIGDKITSMGHSEFRECPKLTVFICKAITPPTIGTAVFNTTSQYLRIFVPDESVEAYKAATNWSTYASRIYPLSEYEAETM